MPFMMCTVPLSVRCMWQPGLTSQMKSYQHMALAGATEDHRAFAAHVVNSNEGAIH